MKGEGLPSRLSTPSVREPNRGPLRLRLGAVTAGWDFRIPRGVHLTPYGRVERLGFGYEGAILGDQASGTVRAKLQTSF